MRRFRMMGAAASVAALIGAAVAAGGPAAAATTNGVGTTRATTTVLNVALGNNGSLLNVRLVGDDGTANIDPKQGSPSSAASSISPLDTTSSVSALNIAVPKVSVSSTGAADNKSVPSIDLATPLTTGSISPLSLSAAVDSAQGAASGLNSVLKNVTAVGGLLSVPSATSSLGATAKPADADGLRGASIPSIEVLNLGAVLAGLGVNPANLTVAQVSAVIDALKTTIPSDVGNLDGAGLTQLSDLQALLAAPPLSTLLSTAPTTPLTDPAVAPVLGAITAALGGTIPPGYTVADLQTLLTDTFTSAVNAIGTAPLLQVKDLVVGITTKAADTVANSTSSINASLGSIQVGSATIPGVDLATVVSGANSAINSVLTAAGLGNLITVKALDQSKSLGTQGGYVSAVANLTGVHVAIAPLSSLAGGATSQAGTDTMNQILGSGNVPALSTAMSTLNGLLQTTSTGALADGATVDVLGVGAASQFVPASSTTPANPSAPSAPAGTLATTGGPTQLLGLVGLLLLATVAGLRWLRRPATSN